MNRRGMSLIEVVFACGISLVVLAIGFRAYATLTRIDDVESHREMASLTVQTAIDAIKRDVRAGSSVSGSGQSMSISGPSGRIAYRTVSGGLQRVTSHGRRVFRGASAEFSSAGGNGVQVKVRAKDKVHGRPIRIEVSSFVRPRNH
jgi:hypothetical protein